MRYFARLNENDICTEIISTKKDLRGIRGFVEIPNYNETLLYKKWLGNQWSIKKYEPTIESKLQDRLDIIDTEMENKQASLDKIAKELSITNDALAEMMTVLFKEE